LSTVTGSGITDVYVEATKTVTVQAVRTNGSLKSTGGDVFYFSIDQSPSMTLMADNSDGTYSADYIISDAGTIDVSVFYVE
jgi:hypothetical protein